MAVEVSMVAEGLTAAGEATTKSRNTGETKWQRKSPMYSGNAKRDAQASRFLCQVRDVSLFFVSCASQRAERRRYSSNSMRAKCRRSCMGKMVVFMPDPWGTKFV